MFLVFGFFLNTVLDTTGSVFGACIVACNPDLFWTEVAFFIRTAEEEKNLPTAHSRKQNRIKIGTFCSLQSEYRLKMLCLGAAGGLTNSGVM